MSGQAQAAEQVPCERCSNGHYVVEAAADGSPRVRCNSCGHIRDTDRSAAAASAGKWTVIGPDGKSVSFNTWEELTGSGRPNALGIDQTNLALPEMKAPSSERRSASALLDITPLPGPARKLALAEADSSPDLADAVDSSASLGASGRLEPLLVRGFNQPPKEESPARKVEWAPKLDKASFVPVPETTTENATRNVTEDVTEVTRTAETTDRYELDGPTSSDLVPAAESVDEVAPESLDANELQDLHDDEPDPHDLLSLADLIVVPPAEKRPSASPQPEEPKKSEAPLKSVPPPAPRPMSLSRPDTRPQTRAELPATSLPPPTINPSLPPPTINPEETTTPPASEPPKRPAPARAAVEEEPPTRMWIWAAVAVALLIGVAWRLSSSSEDKPAPPAPATIATPTPVTTPAVTATAPTSSEPLSVEPPPSASSAPAASSVAAVVPAVSTPAPYPTGEGRPLAAPAPKASVATTTDAATESISDLLDRAGAARRKGDSTTARELYQRVVTMSPDNVEANGGLGDVAHAQGDLAAATASYERALAASPSYSPALLGLADIEWEQGNQASARKRYAQVVERLGDRAPARAKERSVSGQ